MRDGDTSRRRRQADPVRLRWFSRYRALRFARRFGFGDAPATPLTAAPLPLENSNRQIQALRF
jgi:hypothetical protein